MLHFSYTLYIERNGKYLTGKMKLLKKNFFQGISRKHLNGTKGMGEVDRKFYGIEEFPILDM